jgi:hypothetical protein
MGLFVPLTGLKKDATDIGGTNFRVLKFQGLENRGIF